MSEAILNSDLLPHANVLFIFVIIKQPPLLPELVLGPGPGQAAGGEQRELAVQGLVRSEPGRLLSVRPPFDCRRNICLLLHRLLFPQQRAREVGGIFESWTPFLLKCQTGQISGDNFIHSAERWTTKSISKTFGHYSAKTPSSECHDWIDWNVIKSSKQYHFEEAHKLKYSNPHPLKKSNVFTCKSRA